MKANKQTFVVFSGAGFWTKGKTLDEAFNILPKCKADLYICYLVVGNDPDEIGVIDGRIERDSETILIEVGKFTSRPKTREFGT